MIIRKKAAIELDTLIVIIVVALIILLLTFLIFDNQILDWFRNLPGYEKDTRDKLVDSLPEDSEVQLNYFKVAVVKQEKLSFCVSGDCNNLNDSNLYWTGSVDDGTIYVSRKGLFQVDVFSIDKKVASVVNGRIILDSDLRNKMRGGFSIDSALPSREDLFNLDNAVYISGVIYRNGEALSQQSAAWEKILEDYDKIKCVVSENTCRISNFPCACFTKTTYDLKENFELCDESEPYCYNREVGCSEYGSDTVRGINLCKDSLGEKFVQAEQCQVDSDGKVVNAPCTCGTFGGLVDWGAGKDVALETCLDGQYCYRNENGCADVKK